MNDIKNEGRRGKNPSDGSPTELLSPGKLLIAAANLRTVTYPMLLVTVSELQRSLSHHLLLIAGCIYP